MAAPSPSIYKGFSTIHASATRSAVLTNIDLVKNDLLNHFYTSPGENRMRPLFGCRLRQMLYDQFTTADRQSIIDEVMSVVQADPRVTYISSTITNIQNGIVIAVQLQFNQFAVIDTLIAQFNQDSDALYGFSGN